MKAEVYTFRAGEVHPMVLGLFPKSECWFMTGPDGLECKIILSEIPLGEHRWLLTLSGRDRMPTQAEIDAAVAEVGPPGVTFRDGKKSKIMEGAEKIAGKNLLPFVARLEGRKG